MTKLNSFLILIGVTNCRNLNPSLELRVIEKYQLFYKGYDVLYRDIDWIGRGKSYKSIYEEELEDRRDTLGFSVST